MKDRQVLTMDEDKVLDEAAAACRDLVERAGIETRDLLGAPWPQRGPRWRKAAGPAWYEGGTNG
jgi:hypothetical protein